MEIPCVSDAQRVCSTCRFGAGFGPATSAGECHRYAPRPLVLVAADPLIRDHYTTEILWPSVADPLIRDHYTAEILWPSVDDNDTCGEWRAR